MAYATIGVGRCRKVLSPLIRRVAGSTSRSNGTVIDINRAPILRVVTGITILPRCRGDVRRVFACSANETTVVTTVAALASGQGVIKARVIPV